MSKTYSLDSTGCKGGMNSSWSGNWNNFYLNNSGNTRRAGASGTSGPYLATYYLFDTATLTSLRAKTVTSIVLKITASNVPGGTSDLYAVRAKYDSSTGSNSGGTAWRCTDPTTNISYVNSSTTTNISLGTTVPQYGYVIGPNAAGYYAFLELGSTAKLEVTTNEVTVNYKKGANGTGSDVSDVITPGAALRGATYSRTGYTQTGWSTSDGGSKVYNLSATYSGTSDLTLYPYWSINTYTVSYDANGGTGAPSAQTKNYGSSITLSSTKPTRSNASAGSYTVTFNANSGSVNPSSLSAARTTSYSFASWNTAQNGSGTAYASGATYSANASATLYAQWSSSTSTAAVTLPTPTRSNYNFNGWYTASSGGTKIGNAGASYTPTGNVTLYAQWTAAAATLGNISSSVICGNTFTANWTSTGSTYKYKITVTCGNAVAASSSLTAANAHTASVTIPTSWYSMSNGPMKSSTSATATCTLTTYASDGTTQIGTVSTKTFEVTVPTSVVPNISSMTYAGSSENPVVTSWYATTVVQGYSYVTLSIAATPGAGAALASIRYYGQGIDTTTTYTDATTPNVIDVAGTFTYTAVYTDTRGRTGTKTCSVTVHPYAAPSITGIDVARCDNDLTENNGSGLYFKATPHYSISSVNSKNSIQTQTIQYKLHTSSTWSTAETCADGTVAGPWSSSITSAYDVKVTVSDKLNTSTKTVTLPGASGIWYGKGNDRLGLGSPPPGAGLYCDWDVTFNGVVDVTPRRCYATLSSNGWYRCLTFDSGRATDSGDALGVFGTIIDIFIARWYANGVNEVHKVTLLLRYNGVQFVDETSSSGLLAVSKIRWNYETNNTAKGYLDIYYDLNLANNVTVWFNIYPCYPSGQNMFSTSGLSSVAASPSGETVLATHDFIATGHNFTMPIYMNGTLLHA